MHRFDEPDTVAALGLAASGHAAPQIERSTGAVTTIHLRYEDGAQDAEALLIDPATEAIIIVTKAIFSDPKVYARSSFEDGTLSRRGSMSSELTGVSLTLVTAADVTPAGDYVALRTYDGAYLFRRAAGQSIPEALLGPACPVPVGPEKQGEALALLERPGRAPAVATMSEGQVTTLWITEPASP